jgi:hypothetical protein
MLAQGVSVHLPLTQICSPSPLQRSGELPSHSVPSATQKFTLEGNFTLQWLSSCPHGIRTAVPRSQTIKSLPSQLSRGGPEPEQLPLSTPTHCADVMPSTTTGLHVQPGNLAQSCVCSID